MVERRIVQLDGLLIQAHDKHGMLGLDALPVGQLTRLDTDDHRNLVVKPGAEVILSTVALVDCICQEEREPVDARKGNQIDDSSCTLTIEKGTSYESKPKKSVAQSKVVLGRLAL
jgi:hypothetical protein